MIRILRWVGVLAGLAALVPLAAFVGFGLLHGLDVGNGLKHLFVEAHGETIAPDRVPYHAAVVRWRGDIQDLALSEASGLSCSTRRHNLLWAVNDSGNEPRLFAMSLDGSARGSWAVDLPALGDWEDLASFRQDGVSYLLIADIGDNLRWRPTLYLHVVVEPDIERLRAGDVLEAARTIRYRYPDGPRDAEAVAVDVSLGEILIVSKRVIPAEVYRLPLAGGDGILTAERIAVLDGIPQPTERDLYEDPKYGPGRSEPTAMEIAGNQALVVTYKDAYLYRRRNGETWGETFAGIPERIALPRIGQQEAAAFTPDGRRFFTTAERVRGRDSTGIFEIEM